MIGKLSSELYSILQRQKAVQIAYCILPLHGRIAVNVQLCLHRSKTRLQVGENYLILAQQTN